VAERIRSIAISHLEVETLIEISRYRVRATTLAGGGRSACDGVWHSCPCVSRTGGHGGSTNGHAHYGTCTT
jgi:hypothetical protein